MVFLKCSGNQSISLLLDCPVSSLEGPVQSLFIQHYSTEAVGPQLHKSGILFVRILQSVVEVYQFLGKTNDLII